VEKRNAYKILVGKPEGKRPLGRPRRSWVDNIKMDLRRIVWGGIDWINLAKNRDKWRVLMNTIPTNGISTLSWWWGLRAPETLRAMPAVA
jgi:hypothetical protein